MRLPEISIALRRLVYVSFWKSTDSRSEKYGIKVVGGPLCLVHLLINLFTIGPPRLIKQAAGAMDCSHPWLYPSALRCSGLHIS